LAHEKDFSSRERRRPAGYEVTFDRFLCLRQAILAASSVVFAVMPAGRRRSQGDNSSCVSAHPVMHENIRLVSGFSGIPPIVGAEAPTQLKAFAIPNSILEAEPFAQGNSGF
jgi:hypothetical protein